MTEAGEVAATQAVYDATAEMYAGAVGTEISAAFEGAVDRAMLAAFAELAATATRPVADLGCGPGRVAAFLAAHGLETVGVDLSPAMVDVARRAHSRIPFAVGRLDALPLAAATLGAAACWYSIIHTPRAGLDAVFAEVARVLVAEGWLLVGFQAGNGERVVRDDAYDTGVTLVNHRHSPDAVADALVASGFQIDTRVIRESSFAHELTPQAFLLARRLP